MHIKERLEDFYVEEVLDLHLEDKGEYGYFTLEKRNWTTLKALDAIAQAMNITVKRFAVAGQKDRKGITKQYVSVYGVPEEKIHQVRIKDIRLEFLGYGKKALSLGQLRGNRFRIIARALQKPLREIHSIPNYFDEQRFGGYRPNLHIIGKKILFGDYEEAVKLYLLYPFQGETSDYVSARKWMEEHWGNWQVDKFPRYLYNERKLISYLSIHPKDFKGALQSLPRQLFTMMTQSYQSYLFNVSLSRYLKKNSKTFWESSYPLGNFVFVDMYKDIDWPLVGYKSQLLGEVKDIVEELMKEEGIWYETFHCDISACASEGLTRKAFVKVETFSLGEFKDGVQEVSFFLSKGCYATIVMKALEG
ncbi:tRNA pseudouridine(13) synthase TruD [Candidatus Woesearchaeota archaeon]|nr:tRNA pseudouridine(13) synthase TruD [Candidatus Woesearchaeota archaeon]